MSLLLLLLRSYGKFLRYCTYKMSHVLQFFSANYYVRLTFLLEFFARSQIHVDWYWKILCIEEAHFHLDGTKNTHNCRILSEKHHHSFLHVIHCFLRTLLCRADLLKNLCSALNILKELTPRSLLTYSETENHYASLLESNILSSLQARHCITWFTV